MSHNLGNGSHNLDPIKTRIDLVKLLISPNSTSQQIIDYIINFNIDINTYLPHVMFTDTFLPIIYYCCSNPKYMDLFAFLLKHKVQLDKPIISEDKQFPVVDLLFYSQTDYIPSLVKYGCKFTSSPSTVIDNCIKLLNKGNITKLMALYKSSAIDKKMLQTIINTPNLLFDILDKFYIKIFSVCQSNQQQYVNDVVDSYCKCFKLLLKNGININQKHNDQYFVQKVINTYCIPLIEMIFTYQPDVSNIEFYHYSHFHPNNKVIIKCFYNEATYVKLKDYLKHKLIPDKIIKIKRKTQSNSINK